MYTGVPVVIGVIGGPGVPLVLDPAFDEKRSGLGGSFIKVYN